MNKREVLQWLKDDVAIHENYKEAAESAMYYIRGWDKLVTALRKERDSYGPFDSCYARDTFEDVLNTINEILSEDDE